MARLSDLYRPETASESHDRALVIRLILIALAFKLLLAVTTPLGLDEAYAIAAAQEYSLSFFDHPPISFWLPVAMSDLTGIKHPLIYRAPFLLAGVITTWVMFLIGREIGGSRVGAWSALLYTAAPFLLFSGGLAVVPDGTLNLFSAITVWLLVRAVKRGGEVPLTHWLAMGAALALALASKYQAAWLPPAVLLWMLSSPEGRRWFLRPGPWLAAFVGLIGLAPVLIWNAQNDWASFVFHAGRSGGGPRLGNLIWVWFGQAVYLLPTGLFAAFAGLWLGLRSGRGSPLFLLALVALGPIAIFNYIYLGATTSYPHWTLPGWQFALPLAALWLNTRTEVSLRRFWRWMLGFLGTIWLLLLLLLAHAQTGLLTRFIYERAPDWDYTLSIFDFRDLGPALAARGLDRESDLYMASSWAFAGILDTALGNEKPMRVFDIRSAHHFVYLSDARATGTALYMEPATFRDGERTDATILANARRLDPGAELLEPIILTRGGRPYVRVTLVRLRLE